MAVKMRKKFIASVYYVIGAIAVCASVLVPSSVWRINIDTPEEGKTISMDNADDRWWEQVDLTKLILASNALDHLSEDIQLLPALVALDVCILIVVFSFLMYRVVSLFHTLSIHSHTDNKDATSQI